MQAFQILFMDGSDETPHGNSELFALQSPNPPAASILGAFFSLVPDTIYKRHHGAITGTPAVPNWDYLTLCAVCRANAHQSALVQRCASQPVSLKPLTAIFTVLVHGLRHGKTSDKF